MFLSKKHLFIPFFLLSISFSTYSQTALQYIPSNAPVVLTVNLSQLNKKVNLAQLQQYEFFQAMIKEIENDPGMSQEEKDYARQFVDAASGLGYDMLSPFHFFVSTEGNYTYYSVVMQMGDPAKYADGLRKLKASQFTEHLQQKDGYTIWQQNDETYAWNDQVILMVWSEYTPVFDSMDMLEEDDFNWEEEPAEDTPPDDGWEEVDAEAATADWVDKLINRNFTLAMTSNTSFRSASVTNSDMHLWIDYGYFMDVFKKQSAGYGMMGGDMAMAMNAMEGFMDIFYSDTYLSMGLNFESGKMAIRSEMFFNEDMQRFYRGAMDGKFNKKFLRYVEGGDQLFGYFYLNYNIKNTIEEGKTLMHKFLQSTPQYGLLADDAMKILGIFIDEEAIGNLLKGDLMVAVSGMKMMEVTEQTYEMDEDFNFIPRDTTLIKKIPVFTAMASYGNRKDVMKFIDLGLHANVLQAQGAFYKIEVPDLGSNLYLALHKGMLLLTNDLNLVSNNLEKGFSGKKRLGKDHKKRLCENATVVYWDIPNTLYSTVSDNPDINTGPMTYVDMMARQFSDMQMTVSKKVETSAKSTLEFNLNNASTNSLEQFFNFINDMYVEIIGGARI